MAKTRKPAIVVVEPYRARAVRGPHKDGSGRWYWRAELYRGRNGGSTTLWTGWALRDDVIDRLRGLTGAEPVPDTADPSVVTVADLMETWVASEQARLDVSVYWRRNAKRAGQRVKQAIGAEPLSSVGLTTLERLRDRRLAAGAASGTVKQDVKAFRAAWAWGRDVGVCPERTLPRLKLKLVAKRSRYTPDRREALAALDCLPGGWPRVVGSLLFSTGGRIGEVAVLKWGDVDVERGVLTFSGKTGPRSVPISADLCAVLRAWGPGSPGSYVCGVSPNVVRGHFGSQHLKAACIAAKVPHFSPHALRRFAVDAFLRSGVDVGTAAAHFGHSAEVMLKHYRQATLDDQRRAVAAAGLGDLGLAPAKVVAFPGGHTRTEPAHRTNRRAEKSPKNGSSQGSNGTPKGTPG